MRLLNLIPLLLLSCGDSSVARVPSPPAGAADGGDCDGPADAGGCAGACSCERDDECPGDEICDHAIGTCAPRPILCTELLAEADCLARSDCQAIYSGMRCTDAQGGECESGDPDCTCETFSFAVCVRGPE